MKAFLAFSLLASVSAVHYESPPCGSDEKAIQVMGIDGVFCSPECTPECPTDVPEGVTAAPTCALQAPTGDKYCAILCKPGGLGGGDCGPSMNCAPVPGADGFGLCVYPVADDRSPGVFLRSAENKRMVAAAFSPLADTAASSA